ncbi:MAG TPA: tRNA preQ1(34) S-adenosylmethionine ribosyltransferase-isomerase QueA [Acidimicrobiales bacterium]|nr:tRNA preQ1(34) S-adenosylmethionine ribosyltransferase-isomerase QueA [Acidimicrobiales bacterium]
MDLADFDYDLPEAAIAQRPTEPRDRARLLVDRGAGLPPEHRTVAELPTLVGPGDVVVVNTTRVLPARLRLRKPTGGEVEVLLLEHLPSGAWEALVRPGRRVPPGTVLRAGPDLDVAVGASGPGDGTRTVELRVAPGTDELAVLARHGVVPLPPYIARPLDDPERYQTVFADRPGSVAAPTAGLHLTPAVLAGCRAAGARVEPVDLAVGMGTFRPMSAPKVEDHHMHAERYAVPAATLDACRTARDGGGRVVAVGTTTVRALESAALSGTAEGRTELFIHRPWTWRLVDVLLTNFHLPRSSLLVLVDALIGPRWRELYAEALAAGYGFLSFGDAMLVARDPLVARDAGPAGRVA